MFLGKALLRPASDATEDKNKACDPYSSACHKTCEAQSDAKGEKNGPCRTCWHLYWLSLTLFRAAVIHHKSPSNQVNDCEHHDPHSINEVPIKGDHAEAFTLPRVNPTEERKEEDRSKKKQPDHNMGCV
jgi:hypothetical protein